MKLGFLFGLLLAGLVLTARGEPRSADAAKTEVPAADSEERRAMTRVQILLDRANFRPGKIDGLGGEFTQKAADRYTQANQLGDGAVLDTSAIPEPYTTYRLTDADVAWIGPLPDKLPEQEKQQRMPYADVWELVAEMFHCDIDFLKELNPDLVAGQPAPGAVFRVPDVPPFRMADVVALEKQRTATRKNESSSPSVSPSVSPHRLVLLRTPRLIEVYDADNRLVACFPCTPGSQEIPVPAGQWKITSNVLLPYFRWDKSVLASGVPSDESYNIPPGPNNYVGIVWMGINRRSVGMHGTNSPDQIGRNQSHGCIRLANWDAFLLCQMIDRGTPVEVR